MASLPDHEVPAPASDPAQQGNVLKTTVTDDPNLTFSRYQLPDVAQQSHLLLDSHRPLAAPMNTPSQGQSTFPIRNGHCHHLVIETQFGAVDDQTDRLPPECLDQLACHRLIEAPNRNPGIVQETSQPIDQARQLPPCRQLTPNVRQVHRPSQVKPCQEQSQVAQPRHPFARQPLRHLALYAIIDSKVVSHQHLLGTSRFA